MSSNNCQIQKELVKYTGDLKQVAYQPLSNYKNEFYQCSPSTFHDLKIHRMPLINKDMVHKPDIHIRTFRPPSVKKDFTVVNPSINRNRDYFSTFNVDISPIASLHELCTNSNAQVDSSSCTCRFPPTHNKFQTMV